MDYTFKKKSKLAYKKEINSMNEGNLLIQIKSLEKLIIRRLVPEDKTIQDIVKSPTPTQMQIVGYILDNIDSEIYQRDLENALNLRRATISDVLHRMEKNGLIKREIDPNDTRSKKIRLTDNAKKCHEASKGKMQKIEKIAFKGINDEELEEFFRIISIMNKNLEENYE